MLEITADKINSELFVKSIRTQITMHSILSLTLFLVLRMAITTVCGFSPFIKPYLDTSGKPMECAFGRPCPTELICDMRNEFPNRTVCYQFSYDVAFPADNQTELLLAMNLQHYHQIEGNHAVPSVDTHPPEAEAVSKKTKKVILPPIEQSNSMVAHHAKAKIQPFNFQHFPTSNDFEDVTPRLFIENGQNRPHLLPDQQRHKTGNQGDSAAMGPAKKFHIIPTPRSQSRSMSLYGKIDRPSYDLQRSASSLRSQIESSLKERHSHQTSTGKDAGVDFIHHQHHGTAGKSGRTTLGLPGPLRREKHQPPIHVQTSIHEKFDSDPYKFQLPNLQNKMPYALTLRPPGVWPSNAFGPNNSDVGPKPHFNNIPAQSPGAGSNQLPDIIHNVQRIKAPSGANTFNAGFSTLSKHLKETPSKNKPVFVPSPPGLLSQQVPPKITYHRGYIPLLKPEIHDAKNANIKKSSRELFVQLPAKPKHSVLTERHEAKTIKENQTHLYPPTGEQVIYGNEPGQSPNLTSNLPPSNAHMSPATEFINRTIRGQSEASFNLNPPAFSARKSPTNLQTPITPIFDQKTVSFLNKLIPTFFHSSHLDPKGIQRIRPPSQSPGDGRVHHSGPEHPNISKSESNHSFSQRNRFETESQSLHISTFENHDDSSDHYRSEDGLQTLNRKTRKLFHRLMPLPHVSEKVEPVSRLPEIRRHPPQIPITQQPPRHEPIVFRTPITPAPPFLRIPIKGPRIATNSVHTRSPTPIYHPKITPVVIHREPDFAYTLSNPIIQTATAAPIRVTRRNHPSVDHVLDDASSRRPIYRLEPLGLSKENASDGKVPTLVIFRNNRTKEVQYGRLGDANPFKPGSLVGVKNTRQNMLKAFGVADNIRRREPLSKDDNSKGEEEQIQFHTSFDQWAAQMAENSQRPKPWRRNRPQQDIQLSSVSTTSDKCGEPELIVRRGEEHESHSQTSHDRTNLIRYGEKSEDHEKSKHHLSVENSANDLSSENLPTFIITESSNQIDAQHYSLNRRKKFSVEKSSDTNSVSVVPKQRHPEEGDRTTRNVRKRRFEDEAEYLSQACPPPAEIYTCKTCFNHSDCNPGFLCCNYGHGQACSAPRYSHLGHPHVAQLINGSYEAIGGRGIVAKGTVTLIFAQEQRIVVDTGTVNQHLDIFRALAEYDVFPENISIVINTHGHPQHISNQNIFPGAIHIFNDTDTIGDVFWENPIHAGMEYPLCAGDIRILRTPGHTNADITVLVENVVNYGTVAVAGDVFLDEEDVFLDTFRDSAVNLYVQEHSRRRVACRADYIIPGHGPLFKVTSEIKLLYNCDTYRDHSDS